MTNDLGPNYLSPGEDARRQELLDAAVGYAKMGFAVIPVRWITDEGTCSCPHGAGCTSEGKHPVHDKWPDVATSDPLEVASWWRPRPEEFNPVEWFPLANVGIVTGAKSGIWVLDADPRNGSEETLGGHERRHGALPETRVHSTGSGGVHYWWKHPGFDVRNVKTLGKGLDVKGERGFVVAPPSISGKGPYELNPAHDIDPVDAPEWLLDKLRPGETKQRTAGTEGGATEAVKRKYAEAAVKAICAEMREAVPGTRNDTLNRCAFNLGTLAEECSLDEDRALGALLDAASDAGLGEGEIRATFWSGWYKGMETPRQIDWSPRSDGRDRNAATDREEITDAHLAERFAAEVLSGSYCWVRGMGWMAWHGDHWADAPDQEVGEVARRWMIARYQQFLGEAEKDEFASQASAWVKHLSEYHINAVVRLARGIVLREAGGFDAHPDLLNCANGVVDLRTGELLPHDPALMMTKTTGVRYVPGARHPDWEQALTALPGEVRGWYQARIGQGATGHMPTDDAVLINQGGGENGKTTVLQAIRHALGGYYAQVPVKALFGDPGQHDTVMMTFRGARIAAVEETPEEGRLDIQRVKMLTSPEITARLMRQDNVTFKTTHALIVNTNHEPRVESTDHGTWRRLPLVKYPYTYLKPGQEKRLPTHRSGDPGLRDRMIAGEQGQHEAVLAWIVEGARRWYEAGKVFPPVPDRVTSDSEAWRGRANPFFAFALEYLAPSATHHVMSDELYQFFAAWLKSNGKPGWSSETFASRLTEYAAAVGWDVIKKKTKRNDDRLSRAPADMVQPAKASYQAWHGLGFRGQDGTTAESLSVAEHPLVPEVPGQTVPLSACTQYEVTDSPGTPGTAQVRGLS